MSGSDARHGGSTFDTLVRRRRSGEHTVVPERDAIVDTRPPVSPAATSAVDPEAPQTQPVLTPAEKAARTKAFKAEQAARIEDLNVPEIRDELRDLGQPVSGVRDEVVDRLLDALVEDFKASQS